MSSDNSGNVAPIYFVAIHRDTFVCGASVSISASNISMSISIAMVRLRTTHTRARAYIYGVLAWLCVQFLYGRKYFFMNARVTHWSALAMHTHTHVR